MSEDHKNCKPPNNQQRPSFPPASGWGSRLLPIATSVLLAVSAWFLNQSWNKLSGLENRVHKLELNGARMDGNRFTSQDWNEAKKILDQERHQMDRRLIKTEEAILVLKEIILELKEDIKDK